MGYLYEDLPERHEGRMMWYGTVATSPTAFDQKIYVIIPEFAPDLQIGPCFWQSRGSNLTWESLETQIPHDVLPKRGDECLVIFDNRLQPWVVAWWPYG